MKRLARHKAHRAQKKSEKKEKYHGTRVGRVVVRNAPKVV